MVCALSAAAIASAKSAADRRRVAIVNREFDATSSLRARSNCSLNCGVQDLRLSLSRVANLLGEGRDVVIRCLVDTSNGLYSRGASTPFDEQTR